MPRTLVMIFLLCYVVGGSSAWSSENEEEALPSSQRNSFLRRTEIDLLDSGPSFPMSEEQLLRFEQDLHRQDKNIQILASLGLESTSDNLTVRLLDEERIYQRLAYNHHGHLLDLSRTSLKLSRSLRIFEGIKETKSVYELNFSHCHFTPQVFEALCEALRSNCSVQKLNLTQSVLPEEALHHLGLALMHNSSLQRLLLPLEQQFTETAMTSFYTRIFFNSTLFLIRWPQKAFPILEELAVTKPIAMAHVGFLYASPMMKGNAREKVRKAFYYFGRADKFSHPLGAYGLAHLYEKQGNYQEALKYYKIAAKFTHAPSQMILSTYYRALWPHQAPLLTWEEINYDKGFKWAKRAAQLGLPEALYRVGRLYEAGRYKSQSLIKAGKYFYEATQRGHPEAFTAFGMLYQNPDYDYCDPEKAIQYLKLAKRYKGIFPTAERLLQSLNNL